MLPKTHFVRALLLSAITLTAVSGGLAAPTAGAATGDGSVSRHQHHLRRPLGHHRETQAAVQTVTAESGRSR
jgi:hypothetical protein